MGDYVIKTPDIGEGIAEVELVAWHVKPGDTVQADQLLADVMTDKATVEIPSPVAGKVLALSGEVGQTIAVGSELIRLEVAGAGNVKAQPGAGPATDAGPAKATGPAKAAGPTAAPGDRQAPTSDTSIVKREPAGRVAAVVRVELHESEDAQTVVLARAPLSKPSTAGERPIASPAVRRRAWELGVELEQVTPSGTAGRILHADLEAHLQRHPPVASLAATPHAPASPPSTPSAPAYAEVDTQQDIPVIGLRRKIASKMQESKRRIPHFTYVEEVDVTELEVLREQLKTKWGSQRPRLSVLPFLARAMVLALREFPQINARFDDERGVVTRYGAVHLGIATQTDNGLLVPVLRHAEALDLWACAAGIARVADAARTGRITREELSGSTITLTSLGVLGGIVSTPVINHPEVAIVGVNRIAERPMAQRGAVVLRQMMNLSSSFDHRVVDGADAARFVQSLRAYLQAPAMLFLA